MISHWIAIVALCNALLTAPGAPVKNETTYTLRPIGLVKKQDAKTTLVIDAE